MKYNNHRVRVGSKVKVFYAGTTGVYKVAAVTSSGNLIIEVPAPKGRIEGWPGSNNPFEGKIYNLSINKR